MLDDSAPPDGLTAQDDLEAMARRLEASGRFKVLRRLDAVTHLHAGDLAACRLGLMLDLETTGVDPLRDEARGFRWNGDPGPAPKAWYIDIDEADREAEVAFLRAEIYTGEIDPLMRRITAFERFSERA